MGKNLQQIEELILQFDLARIVLAEEEEEEVTTVVSLRDITERRRAEEAIRQKTEQQEVLLSSIPAFVYFKDTESKLITANKVFAETVNTPIDQLPGKDAYDLSPKERAEKFYVGDRKVMESGRPMMNIEEEFTDAEGKTRWASSSKVPYFDETGEVAGMVGITFDITERKQMEEELHRLDKLKSVGVLAGGIAHDFNNLLTAIFGNIQLARMFSTNPSVTERLEAVEKASMQAKNLTQRLLPFSEGGSPVKKEASISEILKETTEFVLSGSNVRSEFNIDDDIWLAEIDTGQISQVIQNLVVNANQSMPSGGIIKLKAENVFISDSDTLSLKEGRYIKVSVSDEGVGIPDKILSKIFDPYFSTKGKGSDKGTGLGLAVCHSIIEKHGGHITVESYVDVGTTFYFYLPASTKQETEDVTVKEEPALGSGKILVMDDEEIVREIADKILVQLGYEVELASDGSEAIELYKEHSESGNPFDAVILDLTVRGGMGGEETSRRLFEIDPKVKVFVSSGYTNVPIMSNYEEYGFVGAIDKPYRIKELGDLLRKVLSTKSGGQ